jgi:hypothetical protein
MNSLKELILLLVNKAVATLKTFDWRKLANKKDIGRPANASLVYGGVWFVFLVAIWMMLDARSALQEGLKAKRDLLAVLETRSAMIGRIPPGATGENLFVAASSETLAAAGLDEFLRQIARGEDDTVLSSHAEAEHSDQDENHKIVLKAVVEGKIESIQSLLFRLESGSPTIFVDDVRIEPKGETAPTAANTAPTLRTTLALSAYWHTSASKPESQ